MAASIDWFGPSCEYPSNKSLTMLGSILGPLFFKKVPFTAGAPIDHGSRRILQTMVSGSPPFSSWNSEPILDPRYYYRY